MPPPSSSDANVLGAMLGCRRSSDDESVMSVVPRACSWGSMLGLGRGSSNPAQVPRGVAVSPLGAVPFTEVDLELGLESPIPAPRPEVCERASVRPGYGVHVTAGGVIRLARTSLKPTPAAPLVPAGYHSLHSYCPAAAAVWDSGSWKCAQLSPVDPRVCL